MKANIVLLGGGSTFRSLDRISGLDLENLMKMHKQFIFFPGYSVNVHGNLCDYSIMNIREQVNATRIRRSDLAINVLLTNVPYRGMSATTRPEQSIYVPVTECANYGTHQ